MPTQHAAGTGEESGIREASGTAVDPASTGVIQGPRRNDPPVPGKDATLLEAAREVIRVALPLMISTGTFSLVLFADRTLLLRYDGSAMSASMAAGNLFWTLVCLPIGIASMTGAIVSQYVGAGEEDHVGRFLWQSCWLSLLTLPTFALVGAVSGQLFNLAGQPQSLVALETVYMRALLVGAAGAVLETALSGFFSGTERTGVIMWVSLAAGVLNLVLDGVLIFGFGPVPAFGIAGAGYATAAAFWFKAACYAALLGRRRYRHRYGFVGTWGVTPRLMFKLLYFGFPAGLMFLTEAGGFATIILRIGRLGDLPLRATTMAINFNMIAYIPLVGVSIAASVLVGRHLIQHGAPRAIRSVIAALLIGWVYSGLWVLAYLLIPDTLLALYQWQDPSGESAEAIGIARHLLLFVALYVILDATQLITAGALRGAGDTWFVLLAGFAASVAALTLGIVFEPGDSALQWWWWMVTLWVWLLAAAMVGRFVQGRWRTMRMV